MKRLECLDGLRGVLAAYVLLGHMAPFAPLPDLVQHILSHGGAAVDVFFALSGLVITQSLEKMQGAAVPFLCVRAARIFPVFLPVFVLAVLLQPAPCGFEHMPWIGPDSTARAICANDWPNAWPAELAAHLTMIHGLFPNGVLPHAWVTFLGSSWSLSTEWQFYLLALVVIGACVLQGGILQEGGTRLGWALMLLAGAGVVWNWTVPQGWQFSRAFLGNQAHYFALGVASVGVARARRGGLAVYGATLAICLAICASGATFGQASFGKLVPPLVWTACLAAELRPDRFGLRQLAWVLRCRAPQYFGAISYCVYVANEPIHKMLAGLLSRFADGDPVLFTVIWLPGAVLLPVLASDWLHHHVEQPALRWGRAAAAGKTGRAAPGSRARSPWPRSPWP